MGWLYRVQDDLAKIIRGIANASLFFVGQRYWPLYAILVGTVPLLMSFLLRTPGHPLVSAVLLSFLCIGFAYKDQWVRCLVLIALCFLSHSILAIVISRHAPDVCAQILPKAADYWERQYHWISTGENTEYQIASWLPAHIQMFVGAALFSFTSFGAVVFHDGFIQVDLMNYYNAQLATHSQSQGKAIMYGWHIWSIMRGVGYLFVTYEMISMAVQVFSKEQVASLRRRAMLWGLGIGFLLADGVIKFFSVEAVRNELFKNLL